MAEAAESCIKKNFSKKGITLLGLVLKVVKLNLIGTMAAC
jgi:hypothetical protein